MGIRWSALSVSEAMDKVEAEIEEIFEPLWRANAIVKDTQQIPDLPDYMIQRLGTLQDQIQNIVGVDLQRHGSRVLNSVQSVRNTLPEGAAEMEQKSAQWGKTKSLFA